MTHGDIVDRVNSSVGGCSKLTEELFPHGSALETCCSTKNRLEGTGEKNANLFEVIECSQDDVVSPPDQANCSQEFKDKSFGSAAKEESGTFFSGRFWVVGRRSVAGP